MSFLITYSAHLPYDLSTDVVQYADSQYPEYNVSERDPEQSALYFVDSYEAYGIFSDRIGCTNETYAVNGIIQHNSGLTEGEIQSWSCSAILSS